MNNKIFGILSKYKYDLMQLKNVVGIGVGYKETSGIKTEKTSIVVMVENKIPKRELPKESVVPQKINGVSTDVIEVGKLQLLNLRTERIRPVQPGVSIGHYKISAGTLGAVVKDKNSGETFLLSNNHVFANLTDGHDGRAQKGDPILQPGVYDGGKRQKDVIARLERYIPIKRGSGRRCPVAQSVENLLNSFICTLKPRYRVKLYKREAENIVDCAVAKVIDQRMVDSNILDIGKVKGTTEAEIGMRVKKSGRTTAVTNARIKMINATVEVQISEQESAFFSDQFITDPMSNAGDSGSLVLDNENNAVGLLFAGSNKATICNKIDNVCNSLAVEF